MLEFFRKQGAKGVSVSQIRDFGESIERVGGFLISTLKCRTSDLAGRTDKSLRGQNYGRAFFYV